MIDPTPCSLCSGKAKQAGDEMAGWQFACVDCGCAGPNEPDIGPALAGWERLHRGDHHGLLEVPDERLGHVMLRCRQIQGRNGCLTSPDIEDLLASLESIAEQIERERTDAGPSTKTE